MKRRRESSVMSCRISKTCAATPSMGFADIISSDSCLLPSTPRVMNFDRLFEIRLPARASVAELRTTQYSHFGPRPQPAGESLACRQLRASPPLFLKNDDFRSSPKASRALRFISSIRTSGPTTKAGIGIASRSKR